MYQAKQTLKFHNGLGPFGLSALGGLFPFKGSFGYFWLKLITILVSKRPTFKGDHPSETNICAPENGWLEDDPYL